MIIFSVYIFSIECLPTRIPFFTSTRFFQDHLFLITLSLGDLDVMYTVYMLFFIPTPQEL